MSWFKKGPPPDPPRTSSQEPLPPTELRTGGLVLQLIGDWKQVEVGADGAAEYRCSNLPEQLFITERKFVAPVDPGQLRSALLGLAEHSRRSLLQFAPAATFDPVDLRTGNGQAEARLIGSSPEFQAAWLHRGDSALAVSVSLYRYAPPSPKFNLYAMTIFDLARLEPVGH